MLRLRLRRLWVAAIFLEGFARGWPGRDSLELLWVLDFICGAVQTTLLASSNALSVCLIRRTHRSLLPLRLVQQGIVLLDRGVQVLLALMICSLSFKLLLHHLLLDRLAAALVLAFLLVV